MSDALKFDAIKRRLETDLASVDLLWSFLVAALSSYRHDTVLRPFPLMYQKDSVGPDAAAAASNGRRNPNTEDRDYISLKRDVGRCPSFKAFSQNFATDSRLLELLLWTTNTKQFSLKTCDSNKFSEIRSLTGHTIDVAPPNYIFELSYCESAKERFNNLRNDRPLIHAYHGSRLENFHSILNYGLQGHLNKNSVFGEGTYLSSELSVSIQYSPMGFGWERSCLGYPMSCVAVCEIIDDPSVKCKLHECQTSGTQTGTRSHSSRARIADSIGGDVPEKYYVVRNNDVMRVKYLLVYVRKNCIQRRTLQCLQRYKFVLIIGFYVLLLILLGLFRSVTVRSYLRQYTGVS